MEIEEEIGGIERHEDEITSLQKRCGTVLGQLSTDDTAQAEKLFNKFSKLCLIKLLACVVTKPEEPFASNEGGDLLVDLVSSDPNLCGTLHPVKVRGRKPNGEANIVDGYGMQTTGDLEGELATLLTFPSPQRDQTWSVARVRGVGGCRITYSGKTYLYEHPDCKNVDKPPVWGWRSMPEFKLPPIFLLLIGKEEGNGESSAEEISLG